MLKTNFNIDAQQANTYDAIVVGSGISGGGPLRSYVSMYDQHRQPEPFYVVYDAYCACGQLCRDQLKKGQL